MGGKSQRYDMIERATAWKIIKEEEIYECLACGKMYTEDSMYAHEKVCDKIEEYLAWKETQE